MKIAVAAGVLRHWADPLYRQSYLMLASTGVSAATGLLFWVVAAHRVRPDVLGLAAGLVAANAFLSYLTSFALPYAMLRFGADPEVSARLNAGLLFSVATSLAAAGGFALAAPSVSPALAAHLFGWGDVLLFGLAGAGAAAGVLLDNLLAARKRAGAVLVRNGAAGLLKLAPLAWLPSHDPRGLYLAVTLPALVTAVATLVALPRLVPGYRVRVAGRWAGRWADPAVREMAGFALRNYPGALLSGAPQFALPLIAVNVLGARQYAFFYVAWSIAQIVYLVPAVISNVALSQGTAASAGRLAARSRTFALLLLAPAAVGVVAPGAVLVLYGGAYADDAASALRLLLLAALPWTVVILAQSRLRTEHRFRALTGLTAGFCVASLGLPVGWALWFPGGSGSTAMAAGWLVAVVVSAGAAGWLSHRTNHRKLQ